MANLWSLVLPKRGGNMRRWLRFKEAMMDKSYDTIHARKGPITLFDFADVHDAADAEVVDMSGRKGGWRITDDESIGGFSWCQMKLIQSSEEYQEFLTSRDRLGTSRLDSCTLTNVTTTTVQQQPQDDDVVENKEQHQQSKESSSNLNTPSGEKKESEPPHENELLLESETEFIPFIRWWGHIDTRVGMHSMAQRSGFCAIKSPEFIWNGAHIGSRYNAMELMFRTDGRDYVINLKVNTYFPEDLYQAIVPLPATHPDKRKVCTKTGGHFDRMVFRFEDHFHHTSRGRLLEEPKRLDGLISIEHMGVVLMDGVDGDFEFDLARVRVVNVTDDGDILGEDDEDAPY